MEQKFDISQHKLVPKHIILTDEQKEDLLKKFNVSLRQLPIIRKGDPVIANIETKLGDVILIKRKSPILGESEFYRVVVNG